MVKINNGHTAIKSQADESWGPSSLRNGHLRHQWSGGPQEAGGIWQDAFGLYWLNSSRVSAPLHHFVQPFLSQFSVPGHRWWAKRSFSPSSGKKQIQNGSFNVKKKLQKASIMLTFLTQLAVFFIIIIFHENSIHDWFESQDTLFSRGWGQPTEWWCRLMSKTTRHFLYFSYTQFQKWIITLQHKTKDWNPDSFLPF